MSVRLQIAFIIFLMVNAVIFGFGLVAVLATPGLSIHAGRLIPAVVVASFILAAPLAWFIAPRLRARYSRRHSA